MSNKIAKVAAIKKSEIKLSVVIPAYNEADFLPRCLESLAKQKDTPNYEVIVVDNASTDNTAEVAKGYGARVIHESEKGVVHARQAGLEAARGEIIVSTDADSFFPEFWIHNIYSFFLEHPEASGLAGNYHFYKAPLWARIMPAVLGFLVWTSSLVLHRPVYVAGVNLSFRKSAFPGYDARYYQGADERGVLLEIMKHGRVYVTLKNPVQTSSRRVNQGFWHSMIMTAGYYYGYNNWKTKKKGYSTIGSPPAIRTEDRSAHAPLLILQWIIVFIVAFLIFEILKRQYDVW